MRIYSWEYSIDLIRFKNRSGEVIGYLDKESMQKLIEELRNILNEKEKVFYSWKSQQN